MAKFDAALAKRNREAINQASPLFDQLNDAWQQIEQFFRKQGILRAVCLSFGRIDDWDGSDFQVVGERLLGLEKQQGKWRICYGVLYHQDPSGETSWTPVTDCGTNLRVELLDHVTALFEKLVKSNEEYIPEIEQAVAKSHDILSDLGLSK